MLGVPCSRRNCSALSVFKQQLSDDHCGGVTVKQQRVNDDRCQTAAAGSTDFGRGADSRFNDPLMWMKKWNLPIYLFKVKYSFDAIVS